MFQTATNWIESRHPVYGTENVPHDRPTASRLGVYQPLPESAVALVRHVSSKVLMATTPLQ